MLFDLITVSKAHEHMQMRQQLKKLLPKKLLLRLIILPPILPRDMWIIRCFFEKIEIIIIFEYHSLIILYFLFSYSL